VRQDKEVAAVDQEDPADDINLPQLLRGLALPAAVLALVLLVLRVNQAVAG
jgi:hypothetical protein